MALVVVAELAAVEVCLEVGVPHLLVSDDGRVCHQLLLHLHFDEGEVGFRIGAFQYVVEIPDGLVSVN